MQEKISDIIHGTLGIAAALVIIAVCFQVLMSIKEIAWMAIN
jgi:hypothetical protein